jgi:hypothetical protein
MADEELKANGSRYKDQACNIPGSDKKLKAFDKYCVVETRYRHKILFFRLGFFCLFEVFGRDNEFLPARRALRTLSAVLIFKTDHCVAVRTIKLNRHFIFTRKSDSYSGGQTGRSSASP